MDDTNRADCDSTEAAGTMRLGVVATAILFALARGVPVRKISDETGLHLADLVHPERHVPAEALARLWKLLRRVFPEQNLALELAAVAPLSSIGVISNLMRHAPCLRDGVQGFIEYRRLISSQLSVRIEEGPDGGRIAMFHPTDATDAGYASELGMGLAVRVLGELGGDDVVSGVEFAHRPIGKRDRYDAFFRAPVGFDHAENAILLRAGALDRPLTEGNAQLTVFLRAHLDQLRDGPLAGRVDVDLTRIRAVIVAGVERGSFGAGEVAERLGMSLRTLQRLVRANGTSVQALLDQARVARARQLLADPQLSMTDVALRMGYSTDSAFRRAFKRWTGKTPTQIAKQGRRSG